MTTDAKWFWMFLAAMIATGAVFYGFMAAPTGEKIAAHVSNACIVCSMALGVLVGIGVTLRKDGECSDPPPY